MYAVIRTGGKQYKVAPQDVLQIEKIDGAAGDALQFGEVLMVAGEGEPALGLPLVSGAAVSAEVVEQGRGPKVVIFKKKRRQNYRRKKGHRQALTTIRILEILTDGKKPSPRAATKASEGGHPAGTDQGASAAGGKRRHASKDQPGETEAQAADGNGS